MTDKKHSANRANARHSTGPKTPAGKARSSQNALTHGLSSQTIPIIGRDRRRFRRLHDALYEHFRPVGVIEEDLVDRFILARWHFSQAERFLQG